MNDKGKLLLDGLVFGKTYLIPVEKREEHSEEKYCKAIASMKERGNRFKLIKERKYG